MHFVSESLRLHQKLPESPEVKRPLCNAGFVVRLKKIRELQINLALSVTDYRRDALRFCHVITNAQYYTLQKDIKKSAKFQV